LNALRTSPFFRVPWFFWHGSHILKYVTIDSSHVFVLTIQFLDHASSSTIANSDVSFVYHVEQFVKNNKVFSADNGTVSSEYHSDSTAYSELFVFLLHY
jgi:hypothetical protein